MATDADTGAITRIYNQGIVDRIATFETESRTEEQIRQQMQRGFWKLVSRIFPENRAGLALHERAGFRVVGTYRRHAKLDGEWRDCVIVETLLGEAARE
ncbi:MAG TPA: hypothetical protein VK821_11125 [Dehalococcoidia bacterium]|nr:hypothetical protein [Dehalococcoidia bacterium]